MEPQRRRDTTSPRRHSAISIDMFYATITRSYGIHRYDEVAAEHERAIAQPTNTFTNLYEGCARESSSCSELLPELLRSNLPFIGDRTRSDGSYQSARSRYASRQRSIVLIAVSRGKNHFKEKVVASWGQVSLLSHDRLTSYALRLKLRER